MPDSIVDLERQRAVVLGQISELEDFRAGSITGTGGRGGIRVAIATFEMIRATVHTAVDL